MQYKIKTVTKQILADTLTPVSIYLKLRDMYPGAFLLESSDYHGNENSFSFICLSPVASITVTNHAAECVYPDGKTANMNIKSPSDFALTMKEFMQSFITEKNNDNLPVNGLFGYSSYDAVKYFETIKLNNTPKDSYSIPEVCYQYFRYVIAINHFKNTMYIIENLFEGEDSQIERLERLMYTMNLTTGRFTPLNGETSNISDEEYRQMVTHGKESCYRGDVFQIVLSRQFSQQYSGDDFNVYRALRSINPSPYLFYFDFKTFRIFGSSPEAQIKIKDGKAYINPIAGTFRRSGDDEKDKDLAAKLAADPKENAEHVMLVDLARNDLSRNGTNVRVENYREIQFYSHVLHMVSTVSSILDTESEAVDMYMATFPAGTLSGAPKYKAMELIDKYENQARGYYGGAIGYIGFDGTLNHAIMIRTFLSKDNRLFYQAGAGIVAASVEENELQEVNNKLGALKKALELAKEL
ncbi:MAG TPA: anthranilate synthase component I family protein [Bacteroidales bacterium]|nr:anthranilate synthase component I family protein [Bacteroidales bacterium]